MPTTEEIKEEEQEEQEELAEYSGENKSDVNNV